MLESSFLSLSYSIRSFSLNVPLTLFLKCLHHIFILLPKSSACYMQTLMYLTLLIPPMNLVNSIILIFQVKTLKQSLSNFLNSQTYWTLEKRFRPGSVVLEAMLLETDCMVLKSCRLPTPVLLTRFRSCSLPAGLSDLLTLLFWTTQKQQVNRGERNPFAFTILSSSHLKSSKILITYLSPSQPQNFYNFKISTITWTQLPYCHFPLSRVIAVSPDCVLCPASVLIFVLFPDFLSAFFHIMHMFSTTISSKSSSSF